MTIIVIIIIIIIIITIINFDSQAEQQSQCCSVDYNQETFRLQRAWFVSSSGSQADFVFYFNSTLWNFWEI